MLNHVYTYYSHPVGKVVFSPISQQMSEPGLRTNAYLENELRGTSPPLIVLDPCMIQCPLEMAALSV